MEGRVFGFGRRAPVGFAALSLLESVTIGLELRLDGPFGPDFRFASNSSAEGLFCIWLCLPRYSTKPFIPTTMSTAMAAKAGPKRKAPNNRRERAPRAT